MGSARPLLRVAGRPIDLDISGLSEIRVWLLATRPLRNYRFPFNDQSYFRYFTRTARLRIRL